jgi:hypothetical protein
MGPCKECGKWHCGCVLDFLDELEALHAHREETLLQHRALKARHDPAFQRFMSRLGGGGDSPRTLEGK